jgi:sugar O-acyltransferase (sialic acid O-acetyltransferase NeuD family)
MPKDKILLVGAGGHCRSCIDVIEKENRFEISGIVDRPDDRNRSRTVFNYPVIGTDDDLDLLRKNIAHAIVAVGQIKYPVTRIRLFKRLKELNYILPKIISPLSHVSHYAQIGSGTIVMHHALINAGAQIGENCIINTNALIEHDTSIGNHCHISTGTVINGCVSIGSGVFIGSNAVVIEQVSIGRNSIVGAGKTVKVSLIDGSRFV